MTPLLSWIASPLKRKAPTTLAAAFDARFAVGRPAKTTAGLALAAMNGTRLIPEECARRAFINGLRRSALRAMSGRRIPIGTRNKDGTRSET
jgi:hypothetical protein